MSSVLALGAAGALLILALVDLSLPGFRFWPPPEAQSWQSKSFRGLFRLMVYGQVIASAGYFVQHGARVAGWQFGVAGALFVLGFVMAFFATGQLGWSTAFGASGGLRTDGIFAWSRNPIYVATIFGLIGWGILVPSAASLMTLTCWGGLYVVAVFLEERWLRQNYGADFAAYCRKVRRFL